MDRMTGTMLQPLTERTFTPTTTRPVLGAVCEAMQLDPSDATVLRHHTNAVYRLATAPIVVKISRPGTSDAGSTVRLVEWISKHGVPSVALARGAHQPMRIAGCEVTLWDYLPQIRAISAGDIALPLAALHRTPPLPDVPRLDPIPVIDDSIALSRCLTDHEKSALHQHARELTSAWEALTLDSTSVLLHGDPQHRNTLWDDSRNRAVLCDWESAMVGPAEWDLVTIEIHCRRFAHDRTQFEDFCHLYGRDVREWPGYAVVRDVRELKMITSNARKSDPDSPAADEVRRRIRLLDAGPAQRWYIL